MPEAATFSLTFEGDVSSDSMESLRYLWTRTAGVQPLNAIRGTRTTTPDAEGSVAQSIFTWTIPPFRRVESPTPNDLAGLDSN
mmetsp:Transcript_25892/g.4383  ORF Transcript_25892/g.4383 Transcript_25892/m.4383 type:complete len:83 (-) Transcript_25892:524-772(-)